MPSCIRPGSFFQRNTHVCIIAENYLRGRPGRLGSHRVHSPAPIPHRHSGRVGPSQIVSLLETAQDRSAGPLALEGPMTDNPLLDVLTREGVLLNVSVRFWRGCKKLKAEDIGLDPDNVSDRLISLGHKRLLPKEATSALALVEGRAHALVESCSFPFLNGLAHFLPNTKLEEVTGQLKELEEEFWKAKAEFIQRYARLRESAAREWRDMAKKLVQDPDRVVANIEAAFPAPERMDRFFGFETQLFQIAVPERLGLDMVAMADHQELILARQQAAQNASRPIHP